MNKRRSIFEQFRVTAARSAPPLFQCAVNWHAYFLVHCIAVAVSLYSTYLKKVPEKDSTTRRHEK
jgi:hypothetical protein